MVIFECDIPAAAPVGDGLAGPNRINSRWFDTENRRQISSYAAYVMGFSLPPAPWFENLIFGIIAARAAGLQAIGFTGGGHVSDDHGAHLHASGAAAAYTRSADVTEACGAGAI